MTKLTMTAEEIVPVDNLYSDMRDCGIGRCESCQVCMQKKALAELRQMVDYIIGEDYPTPDDGRVDSVAEPHRRHLRWEQRIRRDEVLGSKGEDEPTS